MVRTVEETIRPDLIQRLGIRYIDRIEGDAVAEIPALLRQEMLGLMATSLSDHMQHAIGETILELPDSSERLRMRWGRVPAKGTIDPNAIEPVDAPSFFLDLDMFSTAERPFATDTIAADARRYTERIYALFRWAVTDEFLRRYGGKP